MKNRSITAESRVFWNQHITIDNLYKIKKCSFVGSRQQCRPVEQDLNLDPSQLSSPRRHSMATKQEPSTVGPLAHLSLPLSPLLHLSISTLAMQPMLANLTTKHCEYLFFFYECLTISIIIVSIFKNTLWYNIFSL